MHDFNENNTDKHRYYTGYVWFLIVFKQLLIIEKRCHVTYDTLPNICTIENDYFERSLLILNSFFVKINGNRTAKKSTILKTTLK